MCFSAQASFIASGILALIGAATLYKGGSKKIGILAAIPLIFSLQQAAEGVVWLGFNAGNPYQLLSRISAYLFLFFAYIFWPVATPMLLYWFEKSPRRKELLAQALYSGITIAVISIVAMYAMGIRYEVINHHIVYLAKNQLVSDGVLNVIYTIGLLLYVHATIGALCMSTIPFLWIFTAIVATGFIVSLILYYLAFTSVWCFFAALGSCALYVIVARNTSPRS